MKLKLSLFFKEIILFGATLAIGIFSSYRYSLLSPSVSLPEIKFSSWDLFLILILLLFFIFAPRYKKVAHFSFRLFLVLIVFSGTQIVAGLLIGRPFDFLLTLAVVLVFLFVKNVLTHNIGVVFGIAGIASVLGTAMTPKTGIILLVALSFYDIIAVYLTKHMVAMARNMIESGAPFGFIIPSDRRGFLTGRKTAQAGIGEQFMILGSGDIGLPLMMACSVVSYSLPGAITVAIFSLAGLLFTHLIFVNQKVRKPMAALPPIATMTIIGYLVIILFQI